MADMTTVQMKDRAEQARFEATRGRAHFVPHVDVYEMEQDLLLLADVPGVHPEDVDLHYEKGELVLHARVQARPQQATAMLREYEEGDFDRAFSIPESIDGTRIEAQCKNGVLTVRLPKVEVAQPRQIKVNGQ
jgi:HSP20 family protein